MQIRFSKRLNANSLLPLTLCSMMLFLSCKKEDVKTTPVDTSPSPTQEFGNINLDFTNVVGTEILEFGKKYLNPSGDTFTVSKFNYYISNIVLVKEDNSTVSFSDNYYLLEESVPASKRISLGSIPFGNYKGIRFLLGVDSARNVSGAQTGALDPAKGMFWNWSTGYIMLKLEGNSPASSVFGNYIEFHLGGFKGINKVQRNFEMNFSNELVEVVKSKIPLLRFQTNINEIFQIPHQISFSTLPIVTSTGENARKIADNYEDMITFIKAE